MPNLKDLREERGTLVKQARDILDKAEEEKRVVTEEEDKQWSKLIDGSDKLRDTIVMQERQLEAEREAAETALEHQVAAPGGDSERAAEARVLAFRSWLQVGKAVTDEASPEVRALQADIDISGGYMKPPIEFINQLIQDVDNMVFIRQKATIHQLTSSDSLGAPSLDADVEDFTWTTEIASADEDTQMAFGARELSTHPAAKLVKVSKKLLRLSAIPAEDLVRARLAYKKGITEEKAYMTGSGANQPLGLFTASDQGISTGRDVSTDNTTTAPTFDGLINALYSLVSAHQQNAEWIFHRDVVKLLAKIKDGEGQYIWRQSIVDGTPDTLLNRPVNQSEYAPNTLTTGLYVGLIGDLKYYWIADSLDLVIQRLDELYAATHQVGFIAEFEGDGMPVLENAFARVKLG
ncbi:MAG: phage major capsid protein [Candidatus Marinimicrobia bacterium]|nr:phage major capsid protein [Candidatus Neomarinimicrobiota bacterium]